VVRVSLRADFRAPDCEVRFPRAERLEVPPLERLLLDRLEPWVRRLRLWDRLPRPVLREAARPPLRLRDWALRRDEDAP
jgi:hypothetical protein